MPSTRQRRTAPAPMKSSEVCRTLPFPARRGPPTVNISYTGFPMPTSGTFGRFPFPLASCIVTRGRCNSRTAHCSTPAYVPVATGSASSQSAQNCEENSSDMTISRVNSLRFFLAFPRLISPFRAMVNGSLMCRIQTTHCGAVGRTVQTDCSSPIPQPGLVAPQSLPMERGSHSQLTVGSHS